MKVVNIQNLVKKFGDLTAVDNISLTIEEGEIYGLLGPNGAGKNQWEVLKLLCFRLLS